MKQVNFFARPSKKTQKISEQLPTITLTPLIDTVLVLLIVFMVTAPSKTILKNAQTRAETKLDNKIENKSDYKIIRLSIDKRGSITLNGTRTTLDHCAAHCAHALTSSPIRTVVIDEDSRAPEQILVSVMKKLKKLENVKIIVL